MLFKTVYGSELECIHDFLTQVGPSDRESLYRTFLPAINGTVGPRTNFDDALTFLVSSGLIRKDDVGKYEAIGTELPFRFSLLANLRKIQLGSLDPSHPMDPWYMGLVDSVFVRPGSVLIFGLHQLINARHMPEFLSEEKINAWKRVLEFIGLGNRIASGFLCSYRIELVFDVISLWKEDEGPLQAFLEEHISYFLPWESEIGDISPPLSVPLSLLANQGYIKLQDRQDLPSRSYFGNQRINWIRKRGGLNCSRASKRAV